MIDPVNSAGVPPPHAPAPVAPVAAVPASASASPSASPSDGAADRTGAAEAKAKPPVAMDVQRSQGGVFVYTLRDPATDVVLAVIPRAEVLTPAQGRTFDEKV